MKLLVGIALMWILMPDCRCQTDAVYSGRNGTVAFVSEAPLELIQAESQHLEGILNAVTGEFGFQVEINSFEGFNNPLQRIHFQENYLQSDEFPKAIFRGFIIEKDLLLAPGTHSIRAKGQLEVHGVVQERIIRGTINISENLVLIQTEFNLRLEDHNIRIPRIVYQKIAQEINISLEIQLF
jgi:hypothetical protein